ncbi:His Kinase A (phospho-acceptor) domain-containing protein [Salegentibacter echinorum]|uniref:histidine kinase n=1 Tax=Salegentibacter echinorum TaxID=1073325 RepID=A0A1M5M343_SALEC|nr:ATP-binding protein [Salegentibacter echinorum]SHG71650.1 His Kinase A (phospho-acceptor) domain-containing protein [Salegentibacter echinorum]
MPANIPIEERLKERIKELSCLYRVSSAIREHTDSEEKTLIAVLKILKDAWRFPELATVELKKGNLHLTTNPIPESSHYQKSEFKIFKKDTGYVKVYYPFTDLSKAHFLIDEQRLLDKVTYEIAVFFERQQLRKQEELLQRTAERNDRLSILSEITAGIAHELNTPLGNILGFAEFIESKSTEEQSRQDASKIIKAAIYSREVVKKLMLFSCEMPQDIQVIPINPIITQALSLLSPNLRKANIETSYSIANPNLKAQVDPIQLTQVLFNLLINAIYHSPEHSVIKIEVLESKNHFYIKIADEGKGIEQKNKEKIFEPFFTTKPLGEGSGLGLSVVHGIVKSHKGTITTLQNKPKGTIFSIKLPIKL